MSPQAPSQGDPSCLRALRAEPWQLPCLASHSRFSSSAQLREHSANLPVLGELVFFGDRAQVCGSA